MARRSVISQLASAGEEALGQLAQNPVTRKAVEGALQVKERVEKLVTGVADIDKRLKAVERRLDALEKPKRSTTTRARSTTSKARSTTKKT